MRTRRSVAALASAVAVVTGLAGGAGAERPPAGQTLDVSREIALPASVARPCIAVIASGASILLARDPLEAAAAATPHAWKDERERQALIRGRRAKALLAQVAGSVDDSGCAPIEAVRLEDTAHLVAELLEAGEAAVVAHGATSADRTIAVRYQGLRAGPTSGFGEIRFLRGEPRREFLTVHWWRS